MSTCGFILTVTPCTTNAVQFIDKNDGWIIGSCEFENVLDDVFAISNPRARQARRLQGEEGGVSFSGYSLGKVGLSCTWRLRGDTNMYKINLAQLLQM